MSVPEVAMHPTRTMILAALAATALTAACTRAVVYQERDPKPVVVQAEKNDNGPPPHAPAHGYRAKHQYRYYPCCSTYYDADRGMWFYIKTGDWAIGASIPTGLKAQLGHYVNISMDTDRPYEFNDEHRKDYPAEKYKKKK
jgi:hypothetical protein